MTTANPQAPATKEDIQSMLTTVMTAISDIEKRMVTKEDAMEFATKEDVMEFATKEDIKGLASKVEFEQLRHDVLGALKDLKSNDAIIANHGERIAVLEVRMDLQI